MGESKPMQNKRFLTVDFDIKLAFYYASSWKYSSMEEQTNI